MTPSRVSRQGRLRLEFVGLLLVHPVTQSAFVDDKLAAYLSNLAASLDLKLLRFNFGLRRELPSQPGYSPSLSRREILTNIVGTPLLLPFLPVY